MLSAVIFTGLVILEIAVMARAILRPHRDPASRIAWVVVIGVLPVAGIVAYILFGETSIGRRRLARNREVVAGLEALTREAPTEAPDLPEGVPERHRELFRSGRTVNGFLPVGGNTASLMADSRAAIASVIADMDAAQDHIHLSFYIWLEDESGRAVASALERAAARGVTCRAIADGLGSRAMITSATWQSMQQAGVRLAVALPIGNPLLRALRGRIDLRNHRKIVVIDGRITYCGSQNCADPEFRVKPRYAPWVDVLMRFEGPIAHQNQIVFAGDWMAQVAEDLCELLAAPRPASEQSPRAGFTAQVIATGPTVRASAMPEIFETLIFAARRELVITTPYYVPDDPMQAALVAAAHRGVKTTIVFPARNDSWIVAAASRSYYRELLVAGVRIHEYVGGLLHAKTVTLDGEISLIGSANMDRRSFELNYENNILLHDEGATAALRARQDQFLASSRAVTLEEVEAWSVARRLWHNTLGMFGPLI